MAKEQFSTYLEEIRFQQRIWERKPILRELYRGWYADCAACFSPLRPILEVGAGCGNFKQFFGDEIASDVFHNGDWINLVMDAQDLSLKPGTVGNVFAFDVLHHLPRPLEFLRQAMAALKPGGRLVMCEPAVSLWSRFVYGTFHHEPLDLSYDVFGLDGVPRTTDPGRTFANNAIPELIFFRGRERTLELLRSAKMTTARKFAFMLYPLSGGYGYRSFIPLRALPFLMKVEDAITRVLPGSLISLRMLVVLEKRSN